MLRTKFCRRHVLFVGSAAILIAVFGTIVLPAHSVAAHQYRMSLGPEEPVGGGGSSGGQGGVPDEPTIGAPSMPGEPGVIQKAPVTRSSAQRRTEIGKPVVTLRSIIHLLVARYLVR